jgi:hypothetical protein
MPRGQTLGSFLCGIHIILREIAKLIPPILCLLTINVVRDTYEEKSDSDTEEDTDTDNKTEQETETSESESGESSDDDDRESTDSTDAQRAGDDGGDDVAYDVEGGISMTDIDSDVVDGDPNEQSDTADSTDQSPSQDHGNTDGTTRFQTYEEPDLDNPAIDVDVDAVRQFVDAFAEVNGEGDPNLAVGKDDLMNAFDEWAEINKVDLNELSQSIQLNKRKGTMKQILNKLFNVESGKVTVDGNRVMGFKGIEMSDSGYELVADN